ncbi:MAG: fused MFS/spermidine synthase [candidate division WOR-3 bacterium]
MPVLLFIAFLSGFTMLIYELIWARLLVLTFGTTAFANTLVIATFMLGLGWGGIYFGRLADRFRNPVKLFAYLQMGIGFGGFLLLFILPALPGFFSKLVRIFSGADFGFHFLRWLVSFLILLVPASLMGGTFPVMSKIYLQQGFEIKKGIGMVYGIHTLGGVLGALLTGFLFIRNLGMIATQLLAILINLIISLSLFRIQPARAVEDLKPKSFTSKPNLMEGFSRFLPMVAFLTGFASLACEIFWLRALLIFLTNSTYTFAIILGVFLTGIFLGSLIFARLSSKYRLDTLLASVQIFMGLWIIGGALFMNQLPRLLFLLEGILEIPFLRIFLPALFLALVVMVVPTVLMGINFPLLCSLSASGSTALGSGVGKIYFFNTIGSALGAVFTGVFLIAWVGVLKGLILIAALNLGLGLLFSILSRAPVWNFFLVGAAILLMFYSLPQRYILPPSLLHTPGRQDRVLYYKETREGTIVVSEDQRSGVRSCYVNNNAVIGTTYDALKVVKLLGTLPIVFNPEAKEALVIGFGVGITTATLAQYELEKIDCVELCPDLFEAARYFTNHNKYVFKNPKVNFISGDGRNFLLQSNKKYDIISCDPTHPILGSNNLYTREYFLLCKDHLTEKGVVCQYLPLHKLSPNEFRILIRTFASVFPYTTIWLGYSHGIMVGTQAGIRLRFERLKIVKDEMLKDPYLLAVACLLIPEDLANITQNSPLNTDNNPLLEFFTPGSLKRENWESNIKQLFARRADLAEIFEGIDDLERLNRYLLGQRYFIEGLIYQNQRNYSAMHAAFQKVLEVNPENQEVRLFLRAK